MSVRTYNISENACFKRCIDNYHTDAELCSQPHSELLDQIYNGSAELDEAGTGRERINFFQAARRAAHRDGSTRREPAHTDMDDDEMRDFEDYIWEDMERNNIPPSPQPARPSTHTPSSNPTPSIAVPQLHPRMRGDRECGYQVQAVPTAPARHPPSALSSHPACSFFTAGHAK